MAANPSAPENTRVAVGIIGCGNILPQYVKGIRAFQILDLVACADLMPDRAQAAAAEWQIPHAYTVDQLLADPTVQIVVNLTNPLAHAPIDRQILAAGKHLYSEKPLGVAFEEGRQIIALAKESGLLVGCAPDTFLGGGLQTCRNLLDSGAIGRPVAFSGQMLSHGPERWHPNPTVFYQQGAGPLLDMGPYYLTALVSLMGAVTQVAGAAHIGLPERTIGSGERSGETFPVMVDSHIDGLLTFANGAIGTLTTSFEVYTDNYARLEIYGESGSIRVPDPNTFTGPVQILSPETKIWENVPLTHSDSVGRGIGVADMASAILHKRPQRASGALALHVLEIMDKLIVSAHDRRYITPETTIDRPAPLPIGLIAGTID